MKTNLTNSEQFFRDIPQKGLTYAAEHTLALGFNAVEFLCYTLSPDFDVKEAKEVLAAYGLPVSCFSVGITLYAKEKEDMQRVEEALCRYGEIAAALGSPFLHHTLFLPLTLPADAPTYEEVAEPVLESVARIVRYCQGLGVTCLYEPQGMYFNGEGFSRFFEELHRLYPSVGVCGDVGNPLFVDAAPEAIFLKHAKDIKHVHLKDYAVADTPFEKGTSYLTLGGRYLQTAVLGEGAVALDACVAALRQVGYTGAFSLETSGEDKILSRSIAAADALLKTT